MRRVGQARKRDQNEAAIVGALQRVGAQVVRISEKGAPDLLVLWGGSLFVMEVKSPKGRTTRAQDETFGKGWPVYLVRSIEDALNVLGVFPGIFPKGRTGR